MKQYIGYLGFERVDGFPDLPWQGDFRSRDGWEGRGDDVHYTRKISYCKVSVYLCLHPVGIIRHGITKGDRVVLMPILAPQAPSHAAELPVSVRGTWRFYPVDDQLYTDRRTSRASETTHIDHGDTLRAPCLMSALIQAYDPGPGLPSKGQGSRL